MNLITIKLYVYFDHANIILIFLFVTESTYSGPKSLNGDANQIERDKNKRLSGPIMHLDDNEYHLGEDMEHLPDLIIDYDDPMFLKQPSDSFVIKNQPATLYCRVTHALEVHFKVGKSYQVISLQKKNYLSQLITNDIQLSYIKPE